MILDGNRKTRRLNKGKKRCIICQTAFHCTKYYCSE